MSINEDMHELDKRFSVHEEVCAERWKETILRIKRLEGTILACGGAAIMLLLKIAFGV
jgi:hypothetical protein